MKKEDMTNQDLFDTTHTVAKLLFEQNTYPWEILPKSVNLSFHWESVCQRMNTYTLEGCLDS